MILTGLLLLLFICVLLLLGLSLFLFYLFVTGMFFAPFVPTSNQDIKRVLGRVKLKSGMQFVDLGCGDGRVVLEAVSSYGVNGTGVEINPLLVYYGRILAKWRKLERAVFIRQDLYTFPLDNAHVIYLFLMPRMMEKMAEKVKKECGKGTVVISRGFELPGLKQVDFLETKTFSTYFYRV